MMRNANTIVVEQDTWINGALVTEPVEAGWATEAIWFINVIQHDGSEWLAVAELSPDGMNWIAAAGAASVVANAVGVYALPMTRFGVWVRLSLTSRDDAGRSKVRVSLTLK